VSKCFRWIAQSIQAGYTMLLCMGLFSTFLVWGEHRSPQKKSPALRRDLPALAWVGCELATALALLVGLLALTVWVLLLLSGFLAAALLLAGLLGLLARVLVLLARVLILFGHRDLPG
jgi:hypothetical protein